MSTPHTPSLRKVNGRRELVDRNPPPLSQPSARPIQIHRSQSDFPSRPSPWPTANPPERSQFILESTQRPRKSTASNVPQCSSKPIPFSNGREDQNDDKVQPATQPIPRPRPMIVQRSQSENRARETARFAIYDDSSRSFSEPTLSRTTPTENHGTQLGSKSGHSSKAIHYDFQSLKRDFPTEQFILKPLKVASSSLDLDTFHSLADSYIQWVNRSAARFEICLVVNTDNPKYCLGKKMVQMLSELFVTSTTRVKQAQSCSVDIACLLGDSYHLSAMLFYGLEGFYDVCRQIYEEFSKNKSLPPLPPGIDSILGQELIRPISTISSEEAAEIDVNYLDVPSAEDLEKGKKFTRFKVPDCLKRNKKDGDAKSLFSLGTFKGCSNSTIDAPVGSPTPRPPKISETPRPEAIFMQRHTILCFDRALEDTVTLTWEPQCGIEGLYFDVDKRLKAGSLSALIRLLTSADSRPDAGLCQLLLNCFRLFTTPKELLEELSKTVEASLKECLAREAEQASTEVRSRVLAVINCWLHQHWEAESDSVVIWRIRAFLKHLEETDAKRELKSSIDVVLSKIDELELSSGEDLAKRHLQVLAAAGDKLAPTIEPVKFEFPSTVVNSLEGITLLDNKAGCEAFSRHLTITMSELYRKLKPSDVVNHWFHAGDCAPAENKNSAVVGELKEISSYGETLTFWIIWSIIDPVRRNDRVRMIRFWVGIGVHCMAHLDYATSRIIYASVCFSSVTRMVETLLAVPLETKIQFQTLEDFFDGHDTQFRKTYDNIKPSLPCTAPLLRDVVQSRTAAKLSKSGEGELSEDGVIRLRLLKVVDDARRVLNKALIEYKFYKDDNIQRWLEACTRQFIFEAEPLKAAFYDELHNLSREREPRKPWTQEAFEEPVWRLTTTNLKDPLKGPVSKIPPTVTESPAQDKAVATKLCALLKTMGCRHEKY